MYVSWNQIYTQLNISFECVRVFKCSRFIFIYLSIYLSIAVNIIPFVNWFLSSLLSCVPLFFRSIIHSYTVALVVYLLLLLLLLPFVLSSIFIYSCWFSYTTYAFNVLNEARAADANAFELKIAQNERIKLWCCGVAFPTVEFELK